MGPYNPDKILVKGILMGHVRTQKKVLAEAEAVASARPLVYPVHCPYRCLQLSGITWKNYTPETARIFPVTWR
jgi:hypothetical protein